MDIRVLTTGDWALFVEKNAKHVVSVCDSPRKWSASGRMGYEFLNVVHIVPLTFAAEQGALKEPESLQFPASSRMSQSCEQRSPNHDGLKKSGSFSTEKFAGQKK